MQKELEGVPQSPAGVAAALGPPSQLSDCNRDGDGAGPAWLHLGHASTVNKCSLSTFWASATAHTTEGPPVKVLS